MGGFGSFALWLELGELVLQGRLLRLEFVELLRTALLIKRLGLIEQLLLLLRDVLHRGELLFELSRGLLLRL